jgi:hypothetical protein
MRGRRQAPRISYFQVVIVFANAHTGTASDLLPEKRYDDGVRLRRDKESLPMLSRFYRVTFLSLILILVIPVAASAIGNSYTGVVSDSMCGAKHMMSGDDASCTRECVSKGSKYALVVGDKVYTLDTSDKAVLATLDKQAGAKVTVTGTEKGDTITVDSVKAAQ